jgi:hypothetical protein
MMNCSFQPIGWMFFLIKFTTADKEKIVMNLRGRAQVRRALRIRRHLTIRQRKSVQPTKAVFHSWLSKKAMPR